MSKIYYTDTCKYVAFATRGDFFIWILDALKNVELFNGIDSEKLLSLLSCLDARTSEFQKDELAVRAGEPVLGIGIVLDGKLQIIKEDVLGNRAILAQLTYGDLFGASLVSAGTDKSPVSVCAQSDCSVLMIDYHKLIATCSSACGFHLHLIKNMLRILARENIVLSKKIEVLSARTSRDKIMAYLLSQAQRANSRSFEIPLSRDALADYLCVNRSALSRQLSQMRDEGIIDFSKNRFTLNKTE